MLFVPSLTPNHRSYYVYGSKQSNPIYVDSFYFPAYDKSYEKCKTVGLVSAENQRS